MKIRPLHDRNVVNGEERKGRQKGGHKIPHPHKEKTTKGERHPGGERSRRCEIRRWDAIRSQLTPCYPRRNLVPLSWTRPLDWKAFSCAS